MLANSLCPSTSFPPPCTCIRAHAHARTHAHTHTHTHTHNTHTAHVNTTTRHKCPILHSLSPPLSPMYRNELKLQRWCFLWCAMIRLRFGLTDQSFKSSRRLGCCKWFTLVRWKVASLKTFASCTDTGYVLVRTSCDSILS